MAGRQSIGYIGTHVDHPLQKSTVHGVDAQLLTADGKLRAEFQTLASDVRCTPAATAMTRTPACPEDAADRQQGYGAWADLYFTQRQGLQHVVRLDYFDEALNINDLGFLQRNDQYGGAYSLSMIQTNVLGLRRLGTGISAAHWLNLANQNTRTGVFLMNTSRSTTGTKCVVRCATSRPAGRTWRAAATVRTASARVWASKWR